MAAPSGFLAGPGAAPGPAPDAEACTLSNDLGWALGVVFRSADQLVADFYELGLLATLPRNESSNKSVRSDPAGKDCRD